MPRKKSKTDSIAKVRTNTAEIQGVLNHDTALVTSFLNHYPKFLMSMVYNRVLFIKEGVGIWVDIPRGATITREKVYDLATAVCIDFMNNSLNEDFILAIHNNHAKIPGAPRISLRTTLQQKFWNRIQKEAAAKKLIVKPTSSNSYTVMTEEESECFPVTSRDREDALNIVAKRIKWNMTDTQEGWRMLDALRKLLIICAGDGNMSRLPFGKECYVLSTACIPLSETLSKDMAAAKWQEFLNRFENRKDLSDEEITEILQEKYKDWQDVHYISRKNVCNHRREYEKLMAKVITDMFDGTDNSPALPNVISSNKVSWDDYGEIVTYLTYAFSKEKKESMSEEEYQVFRQSIEEKLCNK